MITKRPNRLQGLHNFLNSFKISSDILKAEAPKKELVFM